MKEIRLHDNVIRLLGCCEMKSESLYLVDSLVDPLHEYNTEN